MDDSLDQGLLDGIKPDLVIESEPSSSLTPAAIDSLSSEGLHTSSASPSITATCLAPPLSRRFHEKHPLILLCNFVNNHVPQVLPIL